MMVILVNKMGNTGLIMLVIYACIKFSIWLIDWLIIYSLKHVWLNS